VFETAAAGGLSIPIAQRYYETMAGR